MTEARLCKFCSDQKWYPTSVDWYVNYFSRLISKGEKTYELKKNLAYNMQYLRYLTETLEQLNLSSVLITQTYKIFIITGIGIIECILYYLIVSHELHKQTVWEKIKEIDTNEIRSPYGVFKIKNILYRKKSKPIEEEITFHFLIKKAEKKYLLGHDHDIYKQLNYLRKLRNKIHIHIIERGYDTDWNNFNRDNYKIMGKVLYRILASSLFACSEEEKRFFSFLLVD